MAQHGYARDYDEPIGGGDDDRGRWRNENRERGSRERGGGRDERWRDAESDPNERNRNFMLGDRDRSWERGSGGQDRGTFGDRGEQARSWFRDDDRQFRGTHDDDWDNSNRGGGWSGRQQGLGGFQNDYNRSGSDQSSGNRGDQGRSGRSFGSQQDDHYRSWRNRQIEALDRDYDDYCREREQQFHRDFDSWRQNRQSQQPSGQQRPQHGSSSEEVMELNDPARLSTEPQSGPDPMATATLGTNNSENREPSPTQG